jgi:hypothetical protein
MLLDRGLVAAGPARHDQCLRLEGDAVGAAGGLALEGRHAGLLARMSRQMQGAHGAASVKLRFGEVLYKDRGFGLYDVWHDYPQRVNLRERVEGLSLPGDDEGGRPDLRHPQQREPRCDLSRRPFGGASTYLPLSRSHFIARVQGTGYEASSHRREPGHVSRSSHRRKT